MLKRWVQLWFVLAWCAGAWAQEPLVVTGAVNGLSLSPHLAILRDASRGLTLAEVNSPAWADRFEPVQVDYPSFGYTPDAFWVRWSVRSGETQPVEWLVELKCARFDELDWYVLSDGKVLYHEATGNRRPKAQVKMWARYPVLPVTIRPGEELTIYLRGQSETSILFPLRLYTATAYADRIVKRDALAYGHIGFCLAVVAISLILGFAMKNRLYLINAGIVTTYVLYYWIFNGFYSWLHGPFAAFMTRQGMLSVGILCSMGLMVYARGFSGLGERGSWMARLLVATLSAQGLCAVAVSVMPYRLGISLLNLCLLLAISWGLGISLWQFFFRKQVYARFYLLAWLVLAGLVGLLTLQWMKLLPVWIEPATGMKIGLLTCSGMFLVAIADRAKQLFGRHLQAQESERRLAEARLETLRYQINPHFLFNTLNSVEALSREQPARIPELVRRLAVFLRLTLDPRPEPLSPFEREMEAVQAYLDIEKTRFEERLEMVYEIQNEARKCRVPELILQPLVENAIKHGMRSSPSPLRIRIGAEVADNSLILKIENTGRWQERAPRQAPAGIGLENLKKRLEQLYGGQHEFSVNETDGWVVAVLRLPCGRCAKT